MELRPYQQRAVDAVFNSWREFSKTLLVLPTGTGKTIVFSKVAERALNEGDGKILVLAHRGIAHAGAGQNLRRDKSSLRI